MTARRPDNLHSRLVGWLKIVLPLAALAVLSTLFLVARTIDPDDAIPYADVDVEDRLREPRMTAPTWAGITSDGAALSVEAAEARPGQTDGEEGRASALRARIETPDGASARMTAETGVLDDEARLLRLGGGVELETSTGYHVTTEALTAGLDETDVQSEGALDATGPLGRIEAGSMRLTEDPEVAGSYVLTFGNRVKLVYDPKK
ncbi:LPS export ABC transporter periplasmic protein LptC [Rhodobacter sp. NSM]|uniref:LPS export ABC transporter periplasmic protein LptC n=1 Tax=Rhodobacter sp. NSM TaxID=3457501 RepID=UPI003FD6744B